VIDDIVEMILQEANKRPGKDRVSIIYQVMRELEESITIVMETARDIERRSENDEGQG